MTSGQTVLHVRIDRGRWLRGTICTALRNPVSGHECIVGITARAAGVPAERLEKHCRISPTRDQPLPASLREFDTNRHDATWTEDPRAPERRFPCRYLLYSINDDPLLGNAAREHMLTAVAARIGIELSFTGTALPPHAIPPTTDGRAGQAAISRGDRSDKPARRLQLARSVLTRDGGWQPLDETRLVLDSDPETAWAYAYDLLRSDACEQNAAVRLTVRDTATGRTIADAYHEPVR
ncbi:MAG: hypothetical protein OXG04_00270 [Acidobacteria bacterium]|nr:hypothetical protein [Acidobacteriota bacterium]